MRRLASPSDLLVHVNYVHKLLISRNALLYMEIQTILNINHCLGHKRKEICSSKIYAVDIKRHLNEDTWSYLAIRHFSRVKFMVTTLLIKWNAKNEWLNKTLVSWINAVDWLEKTCKNVQEHFKNNFYQDKLSYCFILKQRNGQRGTWSYLLVGNSFIWAQK